MARRNIAATDTIDKDVIVHRNRQTLTRVPKNTRRAPKMARRPPQVLRFRGFHSLEPVAGDRANGRMD